MNRFPAADGLTPEELRALPLFAEVTDEALAWLLAQGHGAALEAEEKLFVAEDEAREMVVVVAGTLQLLVTRGGQTIPAVVYEAGAVSGLLPFSRMQHYGGTLFSATPSRLFILHRRHFDEMLHRSPMLGHRLVALMSDRVREATKHSVQQEKMASLGRLAAGLAHELNNPAAAVRRATAALRERLAEAPVLAARLATYQLSPEQVAATDALRARGSLPTLSTLERGDREDALADWLDAHDVAEGWRLAEALVTAGVQPADLDALAASVPAAALADAVAWLEASIAADLLLDEIDAASKRIADLVGSVKLYSHLDRAPDKQPVDVRQGLDSTLTMLGHQLKRKNIRLERVFQDDLPLVPAFPGELNQVWTNLIDNAVGAMGEGGTLRIEAAREGACLCVRVIDDGHGIPPDIQNSIFDPFFTTKAVGEGTGLGLDLVQRIIRQQHGGQIRVASEPGRTVFTIELPLGKE